MDIGDLLNILLAVIVIVIAILLALNLPKIAYGVSGQENPFAIYQIAISLNYFSSFPGDFDIKISYPGIEQCEFRIATYHRNNEGTIDKGNSYVSEGFCNEVNHFQELIFDAISAALAAIPINIPGLSKGASIGKLVVRTVIAAGKMFLWREFISFIGTVATVLMSGNPLDLFSSFIRRVAREKLSYFAQVATEKGMGFAQTVMELSINAVIRYVLGFTGIYGWAIGFVINLAIAVADNLYKLIRGATDPTYNCLKGFETNILQLKASQYIYMEYRKVYFSQNLYMPLNFQNIEKDGKKLANLTDGWLYKVSMAEGTDKKVYVLSEVNIYTKDNNIWAKPNYQEVIKQ